MNVYYYCPFCKIDILCERGVGMRFSHDKQGQIGKIYVCVKCSGKLVERVWPSGEEL